MPPVNWGQRRDIGAVITDMQQRIERLERRPKIGGRGSTNGSSGATVGGGTFLSTSVTSGDGGGTSGYGSDSAGTVAVPGAGPQLVIITLACSVTEVTYGSEHYGGGFISQGGPALVTARSTQTIWEDALYPRRFVGGSATAVVSLVGGTTVDVFAFTDTSGGGNTDSVDMTVSMLAVPTT